MKRLLSTCILLIAGFVAATTAFAAQNVASNEAAYQAVKKTNWFQTGKANAPHQIYVIAEPNCSACHFFYSAIQPYIMNGQVTARWIMVAFIRSNSAGKAAAIMSASDPTKALAEDEAKFNARNESGGIQPLAKLTPEMKQKIQENMDFMSKQGFNSTPTIIYKDTDGKGMVMRGALRPQAMTAWLKTVGQY